MLLVTLCPPTSPTRPVLRHQNTRAQTLQSDTGRDNSELQPSSAPERPTSSCTQRHTLSESCVVSVAPHLGCTRQQRDPAQSSSRCASSAAAFACIGSLPALRTHAMRPLVQCGYAASAPQAAGCRPAVPAVVIGRCGCGAPAGNAGLPCPVLTALSLTPTRLTGAGQDAGALLLPGAAVPAPSRCLLIPLPPGCCMHAPSWSLTCGGRALRCACT